MSGAHAVHPFKLASILLQYPTRALFDGLDALEEAAVGVRPHGCSRKLARVVGWLRTTAPAAVAQHYVETFDLRRRCALYLTYYRLGDTRQRGMAMLELKTAYRAAGLVPTGEELPDYLPMVLEFAAVSRQGEQLLVGHRAELALLHRGLEDARSPYSDVVDAVRARLPALQRRELAMVRALWEKEPPEEDVGIEPFAPPGYLRSPGSTERATSFVPAASLRRGERR